MQNCNFIKAGQPQRPFCQASEGRVARARFRNFGAGSWSVACRILSRACRVATLSRPGSRSGRFVKPRRGALLALASVILALGAGPLLAETTFRATAEASATAMANPRRRSRALRCSGAGGWSVGLPETIFPTASLALASVVLALGGGRTGFPKRASKAEGPVAAMAVLSTRSGQVARSLNSGRDRFHTVPYKEVISGQAEPFLSRACRMATLSRPASRSGRLSKPMAVVSRPASLWPFYQEWPLCQD